LLDSSRDEKSSNCTLYGVIEVSARFHLNSTDVVQLGFHEMLPKALGLGLPRVYQSKHFQISGQTICAHPWAFSEVLDAATSGEALK
jgi:hypothetical protein